MQVSIIETDKGTKSCRSRVLDRKRLIAPLPCAANVLSPSDLDRGALGRDVSRVNLVARYSFSARGNNTQSVTEGDLEGFNNFRQIVMVSCE
jgi:hypothetical protein